MRKATGDGGKPARRLPQRWPAYLAKFRREAVQGGASTVQNGEMPVKLYEHTAIWRFAVWCCHGAAMRGRSRKFVKYAG